MRTRLLVVLALLAAAPSGRAEEPAAFQVIVHPSSELGSITRRELAELFLKKVTRWADGSAVQPVEPPEFSRTRAYFVSEVIGKSRAALKTFWNKRVFSGREVPPLEKGSDDEVTAFVRATPGAIGYVAAGAPVGGVKVLAVTD